MDRSISWEDAVRWYREQPDNIDAIRANYFDLPVMDAARRYASSDEFFEVLRLLGPGKGRPCLEIGAGHGIASYALATSGWSVTALEPDPSNEVGAGAIRSIVAESGVDIRVVQEWGEHIPIEDASQDAVFVRQVLHHASDLSAMLREIARVMRPNGRMLAVREHVVDGAEQLAEFRHDHPLHHLYGGENAFRLDVYTKAITQSGLKLVDVFGPLTSILNFAPGSESQRRKAVRAAVGRRWRGAGKLVSWCGPFAKWQARIIDQRNSTPGRIFSFLAVKPVEQ